MMFSIHLKVSLLFPLLVFTACIVPASAQSPATEHPAPQKSVSTLIDKLQDIAEGDAGYSSGISGTGFLPLGTSEPSAMILGQGQTTISPTMRDLVERGAAAIPDLIAHLNDQRTTKITIKHDFGFGGMFFEDEYDYNWQTTRQKPVGVNHGMKFSRDSPTSHTVTVGDLCFVALGQIVNREFNAVRYQPTACIMINSPTYSEALRAAIWKEWGALTPEQHKASLVQDFVKPDSEERRVGACLRLGYYYPETLDSLVLKQLAAPRYDVFAVSSLIRDRLYRTTDASKRKALFDAFVAIHGEVARQGILIYLFEDLSLQESDEAGELSPRLNPKYHVRECLVQLFGYPRHVKSQDAPHILPVETAEQARFIDTLEYFPDTQIDRAVRRVLQSTEDGGLATACVNYLIGRGADADIRQYVDQRRRGANATRREELNSLLNRLGWTPLHLAVEKDQVDRATRLIRRGADVNARAANGQTPLHVAAARGDSGEIQALLGWKANPNIEDVHGRTPIVLAAFVGAETAVQALVAAGGKPINVLAGSLAGRADLVEHCLARDPGAVTMRTTGGETPLHVAARLGYIEVARVLLVHGADVNARDTNKFTPLHLAAQNSRSEMVKLLLMYKADRHAKSWDGKTALNYASENKDEKSIRLLKAD